jgi:hypothetical protein
MFEKNHNSTSFQEFPDGAAQPSESLKFVHRSVAGSENILLTAA